MLFRGVAQFGSALGSGPRGHGFESRHSDHIAAGFIACGDFFYSQKNAAGKTLFGYPGRFTLWYLIRKPCILFSVNQYSEFL